MTNDKPLDPVPDEFESYEAAAAFWEVHDTTNYAAVFETVSVEAHLRRRRHEVEIDEDILLRLQRRADQDGSTNDK